MAETSEEIRKRLLADAKDARELLNSPMGKKFLKTLRSAFEVREIYCADPYKMAYRAAQVDFVRFLEQLATDGGFNNG